MCAAKLQEFVTHEDPNLKYLGLVALAMLQQARARARARARVRVRVRVGCTVAGGSILSSSGSLARYDAPISGWPA